MKLLMSFEELHKVGNKIKLMPTTDEGYYYLAEMLFKDQGLNSSYDIDSNEMIEIDSINYVMLNLEEK